jgi:hypothetical protein
LDSGRDTIVPRQEGRLLRKLILAGLLCGLLALSLSGCFAMRTLTYTKDKVDAGKRTNALISVAGSTSGNEHPFFFLASEFGSKVVNGGRLDTGGVAGGPADLRRNNALIPFAQDNCPTEGIAKGPGAVTSSLVATEDPFTVTHENKFMNAKVPIKAATAAKGGDAVGLWMGSWFDDGDGVPEDSSSSDDDYVCQPPYTSLFRIKGGAPPP